MPLSPPGQGKRLGYGGTVQLGDAGTAGWKVGRHFTHPPGGPGGWPRLGDELARHDLSAPRWPERGRGPGRSGAAGATNGRAVLVVHMAGRGMRRCRPVSPLDGDGEVASRSAIRPNAIAAPEIVVATPTRTSLRRRETDPPLSTSPAGRAGGVQGNAPCPSAPGFDYCLRGRSFGCSPVEPLPRRRPRFSVIPSAELAPHSTRCGLTAVTKRWQSGGVERTPRTGHAPARRSPPGRSPSGPEPGSTDSTDPERFRHGRSEARAARPSCSASATRATAR
jgi:hypothetical protein